MAVGQTFRIKGEIKENPVRFDVDFMEAKNNETYLHIRVDFAAQEVLRNSALEKDAGWGTRESDGGFPFRAPMVFDLTVLIEAPQFSIKVDGVPFCTFRHRASPLKINALRIRGDVLVQSVDIEHVRRLSALPMPPPTSTTSAPSTSNHHVHNSEEEKTERDSSKQEDLKPIHTDTSHRIGVVHPKRPSKTVTEQLFKVEPKTEHETTASSTKQAGQQASSAMQAKVKQNANRKPNVRDGALESSHSGEGGTNRCCELV